jgi:hypothetical protein
MRRRYLLATVTAFALALPVAAVAGTTLYGSLKYSFNHVDEDRTGGTDGLTGYDNVSLFGLKGEYGENIKAFFHLQTSANADADAAGKAFGQRFFMGGLKGNFGQVAYGRMTNAYKFPGFALDPFYNFSGVNAAGSISAGGATYGLSGATNGFTDNALQYVTPKFGPVTVTGGFFVDDANTDDHGYLLGGAVDIDALNAGIVWAKNGTDVATLPGIPADEAAIRGYATYKMDTMKFGVSLERVNQPDPADDINYLYLTGTLTVPEMKTDFSASVGWVSDGQAEGIGLNIGAFYSITDQTQIFALYSGASLDDIDLVTAGEQESSPRVFSIGVKHDFSLSSN